MNLFTPKKNQFNSFIERAKYLMVYRLTLVFTIVFICLSVVFFKVEFYALMSYLLALSISVISLIYLAVTLKYEHLFSFYAILGSLIAHFSCNFSLTTSHYVDFIWMMIASFLAFVGKGRKWGLTILTANAVGIVYFMFFTHEQHLAVIEPFNTFETIGATIELLLAIFIFAYVMSQFIAFQNYSETKLRKANLELETQNTLILSKNRENSTLLKEIHHRVKNNLQIIISLLRLQQNDIKNQETRNHFTEAINRVMVMSSIHQRLYQEKEIARINLKSYLTDLADDLKKVFQNEKNVPVTIKTDFLEIDLKTIVPLGLLLNELISNSYKYAFNEKKDGIITISISDAKNKFELIYSDNGKWQEKQEENSGFGLDLISILSEQLNGSFDFETNDSGTKYHFTFSKLY